MKTKYLLASFSTLLVAFLLLPFSSIAATYKGTITIAVGEDYYVQTGFSQYVTVSGDWTKTGSGFYISSKGSRSCTITGTSAGGGTLTWKGVVTTDWIEYYWDVRVIEPDVLVAEINATNFPDEIFRAYLKSQPFGQDGKIMKSEINGITQISVDSMEIKSLKGIEYLTALRILYCRNNQLTSLDVSKNTALRLLNCNNNQLTALDVSKNTELMFLRCYSNQLTALDVSKNTALTKLYCYSNQLTALDVSKNTKLTELYCYSNQLTALDVSKNTALEWLYCYSNQLTALDVSKNTALEYLYCSGNQLTTLDVSKSTNLRYLNCFGNQLTTLDVSKNTALEDLNCFGNQLTTLDVSKNTALEWLNCNSNQLTTLDVSKNTNLEYLYCSSNQLATLDVSKNTALAELSCFGNQLTALDVTKNTALTSLYCQCNRIKGAEMDALVNSLPQSTGQKRFHVINFFATEENVLTKAQAAVAKAKGWTPQVYYGVSWVEYEGSEDTAPEEKGDVNGDGSVNGTDLVVLTNMILGKSEKKAAADVNDDGEVNGTDYVTLVNIVLGKK